MTSAELPAHKRPDYQAVHHWRRANRTKAGACEGCGKKGGRTEWANVSGEYRRDDDSDWRELCPKCHLAFDGREAHLANVRPLANATRLAKILTRKTCKNGHEYTPENMHWLGNQRRCRTCSRETSQRYRDRKGLAA